MKRETVKSAIESEIESYCRCPVVVGFKLRRPLVVTGEVSDFDITSGVDVEIVLASPVSLWQ